MKVLVVEDEQRIAQFLRKGLTEKGYTVEAVGDADAALDKIVAGTPDLVILDLMLEGSRDGLELCRELRARGVRAKILMLTARDTIENKIEGLDAGADDYLVKPVVAEDPQFICRSPHIDILVDTTGSVEFGARVILDAFEHGKSVVLMNAEVDATSGPILRTYARKRGPSLSARRTRCRHRQRLECSPHGRRIPRAGRLRPGQATRCPARRRRRSRAPPR